MRNRILQAVRHPRIAPIVFGAALCGLLGLCAAHRLAAWAQSPPAASWRFAVAGDSRNCGDLIMPAIAAAARAQAAAFFWDLGDFRALAKPDEDYTDRVAAPASGPAFEEEYQKAAWNDFIRNQLLAFGDTPVFLAIGNHELIRRGRREYLRAFSKWLQAPPIARQRAADGLAPDSPVATYYHWTRDGIDFISVDNASNDQFDAAQMAWFEAVLARAEADPAIRTVIVGMHKPLPESVSSEHGMNETPDAAVLENGRRLYRDLVKAQNQFHKTVYILASHSHYFMAGVFNTEFWKGQVLPGWIIGTAGAQRTPLPRDWRRAKIAIQGVYGYLLATVNPPDAAPGSIRFEFQMINRSDVPEPVRRKFTPGLIDYCFDQNMYPWTNEQ